MLFNRVQVIDF